jgi:hypothetical protein
MGERKRVEKEGANEESRDAKFTRGVNIMEG